jgi:hypothetical protein
MSEICEAVHHLFAGSERFRFPFDANQIPLNGIYILYEEGERAHGADRIVRVGTHTGDNQLRSRLHQHFTRENKDRSIFRKNIGRALLSQAGDPFLEQWNWDLTTRKAKERRGPLLDREKQQAVESKVTEYLQGYFSFAVFEVTSKPERLRLESRIISTVSWCDACRPSGGWLGSYSPKNKIRESGLWLVNELYKEPLSKGEYAEIEQLVRRGGVI